MNREQFENFINAMQITEDTDIADKNIMVGEIEFDLPDQILFSIDDNEDHVEEPHFHLFSPDHSFECCVCIYKAEYLDHNGKYTDTISDLLLGYIDECLSEDNNKLWKKCVDEWINITGQDIPNKYDNKPVYVHNLNHKVL